jgi:hypothetical protein
VLGYIGVAKDGPVHQTRAASFKVQRLQDSILPKPKHCLANAQFSRRHKADNVDEAPSVVELIFSRNPKSTLQAMQLMPEDRIWVHYNPGGSVSLFGLFDDEGRRIEVLSDNFPTSTTLLACEDDTILDLTSGMWVRGAVDTGKLEGFSSQTGYLSKSNQPFLCKSSKEGSTQVFSIYQILSNAVPPEVDKNVAFTFSVSETMRAFDVSADGRFFAFATGSGSARVADKRAESTQLRAYAAYAECGGSSTAPTDVCFAIVDGREMLLVAYQSLNSVHVVDHEDGCNFVRKLETDDHPLKAPLRLATNHRGRVWVGCRSKVVIFDL